MARDTIVHGQVQSGLYGPLRVSLSGVDEYTSLAAGISGFAGNVTGLVGRAVTWDVGGGSLKLATATDLVHGVISKTWPESGFGVTVKKVQVQNSGVLTKIGMSLVAGSNYYVSNANDGTLAVESATPESDNALVGYAIDSNNLLLNFSGFHASTLAKQQNLRGLVELISSVTSSAPEQLSLTGKLTLTGDTLGVGIHSLLVLSNSKNAALVDGDGSQILFSNAGTSAVENLAKIQAVRDGADDEGTLVFKAGTSGNEEFLRLDASENEVIMSKKLSAGTVTATLTLTYQAGIRHTSFVKVVPVAPGPAYLDEDYKYHWLGDNTLTTLYLPASTEYSNGVPEFTIANLTAGTKYLNATQTGFGSSVIYFGGTSTSNIPSLESVHMVGEYINSNRINWYIVSRTSA